MNKISVIIPTLQKNTIILEKLISDIEKDDSVSEIILIDNSRLGYNFSHTKLRVIIPDEGKNLYVNQSWNLGVKEAKEDIFGIFNDDLLVCRNFCSRVLKLIKSLSDFGCLGMATTSVINTKVEKTPEETEFFLEPDLSERPYNWGTIIFSEKKIFTPIPDNIKIWCGDDFIRYSALDSGKKIYDLKNAVIYHTGGLSSRNPELTKIKHNDVFELGKINERFKETTAYKTIEEKYSH